MTATSPETKVVILPPGRFDEIYGLVTQSHALADLLAMYAERGDIAGLKKGTLACIMFEIEARLGKVVELLVDGGPATVAVENA